MTGKILDLGAGNGGLGQLLKWPIDQGEKFLVGCDIFSPDPIPNGYVEWVGTGWENLPFRSRYSGAFAVHVIEHLDAWREMLNFVINRLEADSYIYIEWPTLNSLVWPTANSIWNRFSELAKSDEHSLLSTFNFHDDDTHTVSPPAEIDVLGQLSGMNIIESSEIFMGETANNLVSYGLSHHSTSDVTMGVWAKYGFARYVFAQKM
jgi:hypothetical protein